jgi:hypothetical protein
MPPWEPEVPTNPNKNDQRRWMPQKCTTNSRFLFNVDKCLTCGHLLDQIHDNLIRITTMIIGPRTYESAWCYVPITKVEISQFIEVSTNTISKRKSNTCPCP